MSVFLWFFLLILVLGIVIVPLLGRKPSRYMDSGTRAGLAYCERGMAGTNPLPFVHYDSYSGGCDVSYTDGGGSCDSGGGI